MARKSGRRNKKDETETEEEAAPEPMAVVDDRAAGLNQAAAERVAGIADTSPVSEGPGRSGAGPELPGGSGAEQVAAAQEQLAEAVGNTAGDGETSLDAAEDDATDAREDRYDWATDPKGEDVPDAPFGLRSDVGGGGSGAIETSDGGGGGGGSSMRTADTVGGFDFGAVEAPAFNPLAGASGQNPLSAGIDAADAELGRDSGLAGTSDEAKDHAPAFGKDAIAYDADDADDVAHGFAFSDGGGVTVGENDDYSEVYNSRDPNNTFYLRTNSDGSWVQTDELGNVTDSGGPLTQPDPENEGAPIPEEFRAQIDADIARLRALRTQGPDSGDGATDPVEGDGASPVGPVVGEVPDHTELGHQLFGNPGSLEATFEGGGPVAPNLGADSQGAGVINPGPDQDVAGGGATRDDDPFDNAPPVIEPPAPTEDDSAGEEEAAETFLPPDLTPVIEQPGIDVPDGIPDDDPAAP